MVSSPVGGSTSSRPSIIVPLPERPLPPGPSYPAWEKPLTHRYYPTLRGQEQHRPWWPLIAAALAVLMVLIILVIIPNVAGHGSSVSKASASASASAVSVRSGESTNPGPSASALGSPGIQASATAAAPGTPGPEVSYGTYTVQVNDSVTKICNKFGLKRWELLVANPQITDQNNLKKGMVLRIPPAGQLTPEPPATPTPSPTPISGG
ncbi:MAG TPA: LysM domain-containing protein [Candidatus Limnocylindrales bacterium]